MTSYYDYVDNFKIKVSNLSVSHNNHTWENDGIFQINLIDAFYKEIIKKASVSDRKLKILDVGAQSGAFCLMSKFLNNTEWFAFEPEPTNFKLLCENISLNDIDNINTFNFALGSKKEIGKIYINEEHSGLHTLGKDSPFNDLSLDVEIETIDNLFLNQKIDFIKIDAEGAEYDIILGGKKVIEKYKPVILLEYTDSSLQWFGKNINDLDNLINEINYKKVWEIGANILIKSKEE